MIGFGRVVKDRIDYLIDNQFTVILSQLRREVNEKASELQARFQIGNVASTLFALHAPAPCKKRQERGTHFLR
jgi:hypothetical protein